jgi:hypothetical protein
MKADFTLADGTKTSLGGFMAVSRDVPVHGIRIDVSVNRGDLVHAADGGEEEKTEADGLYAVRSAGEAAGQIDQDG